MDALFWILASLVSLTIGVYVGFEVFKKDTEESWQEMVLWGAIMHSIVIATVVVALGISVFSAIAYFYNIRSLWSYF